MKRAFSIAALGISVLAIPAAFGADGYVTGNVNLRAGPDSSYPTVARLPEGAAVAIEGCVDGWSWCDVAAGDNRGWVAGNFLQEEYQGQRVLIPEYGVRIGIPVVSFVFDSYWDSNYRNRSWYGNREHWSHVTPQYRQMDGHGDRHGDMHEDANVHSHTTYTDASHQPRETVHTTGAVSRQSAVATTHDSNQYKANQYKASKPVMSQHPSATPAQASERYANHAKPVEPRAVEARAQAPATAAVRKPPQPAVVAEHKTVAAPKAAHKPAPEKDVPDKKDNNGKDPR